MTCFWDSVIQGLRWSSSTGESSPSSFIRFLKENNQETIGISINNILLTDQERQENREAIACLELEDGYPCSTSDPVLCLISFLFPVTIHHNLNGTISIYKKEDTDYGSEKHICLTSSSSHCSLTKGI